MKRFQTYIFSALTFITAISTHANAASTCDYEITIGAEYLYWSPCISNMHYAVSNTTPANQTVNFLKYDYLKPDWDSGFRVFIQKDDLFGCFDMNLSYTKYENKTAESSTSERAKDGTAPNIFILSWPAPNDTIAGDTVVSLWKIDYQRSEVIFGYAIDFGRRCTLRLTPFSGVDFLQLKQTRTDVIEDTTLVAKELTVHDKVQFDRELDYCGIGPMLGVAYSYAFCEGLSVFGQFSGSLLVGESKAEDHFVRTKGGDLNRIIENKDKCYCLPGFHFQSGFAYETCVCDFDLQIRAGYDYTQLVNAPSFMLYESGENGVISSVNQNSVTLQGVFVGIGIQF